jgi:hypothetical protein
MVETSIIYNSKYYDGVHLWQLSPKERAFKTYKIKDGTLVALFQGKRGANPKIDFKLKILVPGPDKKPVLPPHTYWVVDLLLKIPEYRKEVQEIIQYYIDYYDRATPFTTVEERNNFKLKTVEEITKRYVYIEQDYTLSLDYVATVIELFSKNEKATPGAYMFRNLLITLKEYIDGKKHYTEVLEMALPLRR